MSYNKYVDLLCNVYYGVLIVLGMFMIIGCRFLLPDAIDMTDVLYNIRYIRPQYSTFLVNAGIAHRDRAGVFQTS